MCRFVWEWIYAKPIEPQDTRGISRGFRGSQIQKSWEAVKRLDRLAPNLVHVCGFVYKYNSPLDIGGGVRGSHIQKSDEHVKGLVRLASNLVHICRFIWERIYAKQIALRDTRVHLGGFRGSNIQVRGSCQTPGPIGTNFGSRLRIHLGMGI